MKKEQFHVDDKVFAKVKGYPAWPAVIIEDNGKKYKVKFYGTGEIGQIKTEDLFYYTRYKSKLLKPSKRKDFNDSVKEIEEAISEAGTDGDPNFGNESINDSVSIADSDTSLTKKRKRSMSVHRSAEDSPAIKTKRTKLAGTRSNNASPVNNEKVTDVVEHNLTNKQKGLNNEKVTNVVEHSLDDKQKVVEKPSHRNSEEKSIKDLDESTVENNILHKESVKTPVKEIEKVETPGHDDFVMERELEAFISYGEYVEKQKEIYLKMPIQKRDNSKLQLLPIFIEDKCIGIKLHEKWPLDEFQNEFEQAVYDKEASQRVLKLKKTFSLELLKQSPDMYYENVETTENEVKQLWENRLLVMKESIMENVKVESKLLAIDAKIKSCLNLDKADPKEAISLLEKLLHLDVTSIMLKKHAHVVDMVRRLKKYVGNLESWNLTDDETELFKKDAEKVRGCALKLHVKFMKVIGKPQSNESFWDYFNDVTTKFRDETKELSEMEFYLLFSWPCTRENFLNNYFIKDISLTIPSDIDTVVSDTVGV